MGITIGVWANCLPKSLYSGWGAVATVNKIPVTDIDGGEYTFLKL